MTVTVASFRTDFTAFASAVTFPNDGVTFWLTVAGMLLNQQRWNDALDLGTELFVAHNLILEARSRAEVANGNLPGFNFGPTGSQSVGQVSESYSGGAIEPDAGHWNLTVYGTRFIQLSRMMGAGPIQVGGRGGNDGSYSYSFPWS